MDRLLALCLIIVFSGFAIWVAKFLFGRWFNPLSLYSALWGFCLLAYEVRLIRFHPIGLLAWIYICGAWVFLYVGAGIVMLLPDKPKPRKPVETNRLRFSILFLCLVGCIGIIDQAHNVLALFSSPAEILLTGAVTIYNSRIGGDLNSLPYLSAFLLSACCFGGIYTAKRGKFTVLGLMPILLEVVQSIFAMSRLGFLLGLILFSVCFIYSPKQNFNPHHRRLGIALSVFIMLVGFLAVSLTRGLAKDFDGTTDQLAAISDVVPIVPSIYTNFAAPPVAFSMYLESHDKPESWFGMYTLAPLFRGLSHLGFNTAIPPYEEFYDTPAPMNTMTYLKNVHSDFGPLGLFAVPLLIGGFVVFLHRHSTSPAALILLAFAYSFLAFSFMYSTTVIGDWFVALIVGLFVASLLSLKPLPRVLALDLKLCGIVMAGMLALGGVAYLAFRWM